MDSIWVKLLLAGVMLYMIWRIFPAARNQIENGSKGSSKEWLNVSVLLAGVVLFVLFLVSVV